MQKRQRNKDGNNPGTNQTAESATNPEVSPNQPLDILRLAVTAAKIGTWFIDEQTGIFIPSARMKELHGYLAEEEMSLDAAIAPIHLLILLDRKFQNPNRRSNF